MKKYPDEQIIKAYQDTASYQTVSDYFGIPRSYVMRVRKKNRVPCIPSPSDLKNRKKVEDLKNYSLRKRVFLGLPSINTTHISGGRDTFRELVRARDNYECQKCGKKWKLGERRLDIHHLDEKMDGKSHDRGIIKYDKKNMDKLITLCHRCHFNLPISIYKFKKSWLDRKIRV